MKNKLVTFLLSAVCYVSGSVIISKSVPSLAARFAVIVGASLVVLGAAIALRYNCEMESK